jgi:hypothetical protein
MNKLWIAHLIFGIAVLGDFTKRCQGAESDSFEAKLTITIRVHNYAEVSPKTLVKAEKAAAAVFGKAGVKTLWVDTHVNSEKKPVDSGDFEPFRVSDLTLHILPHPMAEGLGLRAERLGFTPGQGPNRTIAYVFWDRTEQLAQQEQLVQLKHSLAGIVEPHPDISQILGHVIAHELGHLLGLTSHFLIGIMRADWTSADLQSVALSSLGFTREQSEIIRDDVSKRIRQQEAIRQDGAALKLRAGQNGVQRKRN